MAQAKRLYLITIIAGLFILFFGIITATQTNNGNEILEKKETVITTKFKPDEYIKARDYYVDLVYSESPKASLSQLEQAIKEDSRLAKACHDIGHELGHAAYNLYNDFGKAMQYQSDICNSGYVHGIIESTLHATDDLISTANELCAGHTEGSFLSWQCHHGLGHGFMYFTLNDLPLSLEYCELLGTEFEKNSCINGVFMENVSSDQNLHASQYINPDDPWYPCFDQDERFTSQCLIYASENYLNYQPGDYQGVLDWCTTINAPYKYHCLSGAGTHIMEDFILDPLEAEKLCGLKPNKENDACVAGAIGLYIFYHAGITEAEQLCLILKDKNKGMCNIVIEQNKSLFYS